MITAHKKNQFKRISEPTKLDIALQAIRRQRTISDISKNFGKAHKPWLEILGFTPWYKQAA